MKLLILSLFLIAISISVKAQLPAGTVMPSGAVIQRSIRFKTFSRDSVNIGLNENYQMIEDSCSVIVRQGHYNTVTRKFKGKFKDVNKANPSVILSSGTYDENGLKNGEFVVYNLDGSLRAKGNYRDNKFDGKWEINYSDGKPALIFTSINDTLRIESAWDQTGKKIVDKGKGLYSVVQVPLTWKGKLENGRPNGSWNLYRTDDASETSMVEESFKKGVFQKGTSTYKTYTDASHIDLISADLLPFLNAEKMIMAPACNSTYRKHIVNAQYENGIQSFSVHIADVAGPALAKFNLSVFSGQLTVTGDISDKGDIVNVQTPNPFNYDIANALSKAFRNLPLLHPATVDGKPVKQSFVIVFTFLSGRYNFTYRFLPIKA